MRRLTTLCLVTMLLQACVSTAAPTRMATAANTCPVADPAAARAVAQEVNALRNARGLPSLRLNSTLSAVAQRHACDNAARRLYSHTSANGATLPARLARGGYAHNGAAENTGLGRFDAQRMVAFWRNSPGHNANMMLGNMQELGLGIAATNDGRNAWVLVLAARK